MIEASKYAHKQKLNGLGLNSERFFLKLVTVHKGQRQCRVIKRILHRAQHCKIQFGSLQGNVHVQYTALHCVVLALQHSTVYSWMHCTALHCTALHFTALHCSVE